MGDLEDRTQAHLPDTDTNNCYDLLYKHRKEIISDCFSVCGSEMEFAHAASTKIKHLYIKSHSNPQAMPLCMQSRDGTSVIVFTLKVTS